VCAPRAGRQQPTGGEPNHEGDHNYERDFQFLQFS
jgi:hypothetical protein